MKGRFCVISLWRCNTFFKKRVFYNNLLVNVFSELHKRKHAVGITLIRK